MSTEPNRRILLIDDNQEIHRDFHKILAGGLAESAAEESMREVEDALFGDDPEGDHTQAMEFELASAHQGQESLEMLVQSVAEGRPYAMAFVDMRMPPGWDGVETIRHLWEADSDLQVVVCTAFADYSWADMVNELGRTDRLLILKKPFDAIEVRQLATALTEKWDVTRRERHQMQEVVRAEAEARAYAASLETVNRALQQAVVAAEAAALSRSEFLARMTGGILNPMSQLVDEAERIRKLDARSDQWMSLVEGLCRDGQQLSDSLQDVLDLSELETGALELVQSDSSPRELAEQVALTLRGQAALKGLELHVECTADAPAVIQNDAAHLRRILHHLVSNAVKYTDQGEVRILVDGTPDQRTVHFDVVDSGPGLAAGPRTHLFDAFCHADTQGGDPRDGAGLGLHVSRRLASALGGALTVVHGTPGTPGAHFRLTVHSAQAAQV